MTAAALVLVLVIVTLYLGANLLGGVAGEGLGSAFDYLRRRREARRGPTSTFLAEMPSKDAIVAIHEVAKQVDARIALSEPAVDKTTLALASGGGVNTSIARSSDGKVLIQIGPGRPAPTDPAEVTRVSGLLLASLRRRDPAALQVDRSTSW